MDPLEFQGLVQDLLKSNYGMNWEQWWELVEWNIRQRERDGNQENRMDEFEERDIVLLVVEQWLRRNEVQCLSELRIRVMAFQEYLLGV
jgi:hypothetical protein